MNSDFKSVTCGTSVQIGSDCIIPDSVTFEQDAIVGNRVIFENDPTASTIVRAGVKIDAAAVIAGGVSIGQGALISPGAVVLTDVPPNAIMQGNPAYVAGYRNSDYLKASDDLVVRDSSAFEGMEAPAKIDLGVGGSAMYLLRRFADARGSLAVGEVDQELPFRPERYFLIFDVPSSKLRGEHAHKECHEFLICVHGSCRVLLDNGERRCEVTLDRPDIGVHMPPMNWGTQYRYTKDAVLLVFASHGYDNDDYLRTYDAFQAELAKQAQ